MENHQEWKQLLSAYFDGELSSDEKDQVQNHLIDCPACRKYLKELQSLSQNLKKLKTEALSPDLENRLKQTMESRKGKSMDNFNWQQASKVLVVFFLVGAVFLSTQTYLKRGVQGKLRSASDDIGDQYSAGNTGFMRMEARSQIMAQPVQELAKKAQFEAYYQSSAYDALRANDKKEGNKPQINWKDTASTYPTKLKNDTYPRESETPVTYRARKIGNLEEKYTNFPASAPARRQDEVRTRGVIMGRSIEGIVLERNERNGDLSDFRAPYGDDASREQYDLITENEFLSVTENPLSTFSIDVDTASYSNIRRFLNNNQMPPRDSVRIEEMINYFDYDYPEPKGRDPFSIILEQGTAPWNTGHRLVLVGLQGKTLSERKIPDSNLVFLVDVSGSMNSPDKLPLLQESLKMMVQELRPQERVSLVVYAGAAGVVLDSTPAYNKNLIMSAIDRLQAGGSTAGGQGIRLAYEIARKNFIRGGNNRVILATDGDFNVGVSSDSELVQIIEEERKHNVFLTVLGFGTGNLQDAKMEKIADKGNGNYYYIDSLQEGKKVLVDELGSTIFAIAKDVKIQIEFNPAHVKAYRLIGYENRKLAKEDFNDDSKDAGELGAGHTVTALYEIIPAGSWESPEGNVEPLKYQQQETKKPLFGHKDEMMTVKLRYKEPTGDTSRLITKTLDRPGSVFSSNWMGINASTNLNFASAVAEFGMLLRDSKFKGSSSYENVLNLVRISAGFDPWGHKAEFRNLVEKAAALDQGHVHAPIDENFECLRGDCMEDQPKGYQQKQ